MPIRLSEVTGQSTYQGGYANSQTPRKISNPNQGSLRLSDVMGGKTKSPAYQGPVEQSSPLSWWERLKLSFSKNDNQGQKFALQKLGYEPLETTTGEVVVKKGDKVYKVDEAGFSFKDVADMVGSVPQMGGSMAGIPIGAATTAPTLGTANPYTVSAALGGAGNLVSQKIGQKLGVRPEGIDKEELAVATGVSALTPIGMNLGAPIIGKLAPGIATKIGLQKTAQGVWKTTGRSLFAPMLGKAPLKEATKGIVGRSASEAVEGFLGGAAQGAAEAGYYSKLDPKRTLQGAVEGAALGTALGGTIGPFIPGGNQPFRASGRGDIGTRIDIDTPEGKQKLIEIGRKIQSDPTARERLSPEETEALREYGEKRTLERQAEAEARASYEDEVIKNLAIARVYDDKNVGLTNESYTKIRSLIDSNEPAPTETLQKVVNAIKKSINEFREKAEMAGGVDEYMDSIKDRIDLRAALNSFYKATGIEAPKKPDISLVKETPSIKTEPVEQFNADKLWENVVDNSNKIAKGGQKLPSTPEPKPYQPTGQLAIRQSPADQVPSQATLARTVLTSDEGGVARQLDETERKFQGDYDAPDSNTVTARTPQADILDQLYETKVRPFYEAFSTLTSGGKIEIDGKEVEPTIENVTALLQKYFGEDLNPIEIKAMVTSMWEGRPKTTAEKANWDIEINRRLDEELANNIKTLGDGTGDEFIPVAPEKDIPSGESTEDLAPKDLVNAGDDQKGYITKELKKQATKLDFESEKAWEAAGVWNKANWYRSYEKAKTMGLISDPELDKLADVLRDFFADVAKGIKVRRDGKSMSMYDFLIAKIAEEKSAGSLEFFPERNSLREMALDTWRDTTFSEIIEQMEKWDKFRGFRFNWDPTTIKAYNAKGEDITAKFNKQKTQAITQGKLEEWEANMRKQGVETKKEGSLRIFDNAGKDITDEKIDGKKTVLQKIKEQMMERRMGRVKPLGAPYPEHLETFFWAAMAKENIPNPNTPKTRSLFNEWQRGVRNQMDKKGITSKKIVQIMDKIPEIRRTPEDTALLNKLREKHGEDLDLSENFGKIQIPKVYSRTGDVPGGKVKYKKTQVQREADSAVGKETTAKLKKMPKVGKSQTPKTDKLLAQYFPENKIQEVIERVRQGQEITYPKETGKYYTSPDGAKYKVVTNENITAQIRETIKQDAKDMEGLFNLGLYKREIKGVFNDARSKATSAFQSLKKGSAFVAPKKETPFRGISSEKPKTSEGSSYDFDEFRNKVDPARWMSDEDILKKYAQEGNFNGAEHFKRKINKLYKEGEAETGSIIDNFRKDNSDEAIETFYNDARAELVSAKEPAFRVETADTTPEKLGRTALEFPGAPKDFKLGDNIDTQVRPTEESLKAAGESFGTPETKPVGGADVLPIKTSGEQRIKTELVSSKEELDAIDRELAAIPDDVFPMGKIVLPSSGGNTPPSGGRRVSITHPKDISVVTQTGRILKKGLAQVGNEMRTAMTILDVSRNLRQDVMIATKYPVLWATTFPTSLKTLFSEKATLLYEKQLEANQLFRLFSQEQPTLFMKRFGDLGEKPEEIMSVYLAKLPFAKHLVKGSERSHVVVGNMRILGIIEKMMKQNPKAMDMTPAGAKLRREIAEYAGAMAGRGLLDPKGFAARNRALVSNFIWAPGLMKSRLYFLNPKTYLDPNTSSIVRLEATKAALSFVGTILGVLTAASAAGVEVGTNPTSSDFGKMKFGKTRLDLMGGFQQYVVAMSRLITGNYTTAKGKNIDLYSGKGNVSAYDVALRFAENKEAPLASFITTMLKGTSFDGEPVEVQKEIVNRVTPILIQDLLKIAEEDPELLPAGVLAFLGVGVQTYK